MLIDKSYFVGDLSIPRLDKPEVLERLNWFIEKHEPELLLHILGYELYRDFMNGLGAGTIDAKWNSLLYGSEYAWQSKTKKWKGFIMLASGSNPSIQTTNDDTIVVGRGTAYDPVELDDKTTIPPQFVGKDFDFVQRGFGELRGDEYTISGNILTLLNGVKFIKADTFFFKAKYPSGVILNAGTYNRSLIANYVYYWIMRDAATQTSGVGETILKSENAANVSPAQKMCRAWNQLHDWIKQLFEFLTAQASDYPQWDSSTQYRVLRDYQIINALGI